MPPTGSLHLAPHDVHIWRAALDLDLALFERLELSLSAEEWSKASRFRRAVDRTRYLASHGILRDILGRYTGIAARQIAFGADRSGKPRLTGALAASPIRFNMAHADAVAVIAVAIGREVGVDVERIRPERATLPIAEHAFAAPVVAELRALPPAERARAFFEAWTQTEARLKAGGEGVAGLRDPRDASARRASRPDDPAAAQVATWPLDVGADYAAALAVVGGAMAAVLCWDWVPEGPE